MKLNFKISSSDVRKILNSSKHKIFQIFFQISKIPAMNKPIPKAQVGTNVEIKTGDLNIFHDIFYQRVRFERSAILLRFFSKITAQK